MRYLDTYDTLFKYATPGTFGSQMKLKTADGGREAKRRGTTMGIWIQLTPAERADLHLVCHRLEEILSDDVLVVNSDQLKFAIRKLRGVYDGLSEEPPESDDFRPAESASESVGS